MIRHNILVALIEARHRINALRLAEEANIPEHQCTVHFDA